jgi:hypothetical protein
VGAGTGKLTRLLVSVFDRVVAVEPAKAMRRLLLTLCPEAEVRPGTGQQVPASGHLRGRHLRSGRVSLVRRRSRASGDRALLRLGARGVPSSDA